MPDFLRWELNAAKSGKPLPAGEFIWSPAAHFLFRKCPRAWFFRRYLAQGGWKESAADPSAHAYLLKYLDHTDGWMSSAAEESLTRALLEIMPFSGPARTDALTEAFQTKVSAHLIRARNELADSSYLTDPKLTSFSELHNATGEYDSPAELLGMIQYRFKEFFRLWENSILPQTIAEVDPLAWRLPPEYHQFPIDGIRVSVRPWMYAVYRRTIAAWTVRFTFSDPSAASAFPDGNDEEYGLPERVFAAWCARKYPDFEVEIHKIYISPDGLVSRIEVPLPVSPDFVLASADEMIRTANLPGGLKSELFPRLEDRSKCSGCRFRDLCDSEPVPPEDETTDGDAENA